MSAPDVIVQPEQIEQWPLDRLVPYAKNARTHSPEQVEQIKRSIQEFGFTNPILASADGGLLAGHGRLQAAKELELETVPVVVLDHLTPSQRRAYILADNKLSLNAGWDYDFLKEELADLDLANYDLTLIGFSEYEMNQIASGDWHTDFGDPNEKHGENTDGIEGKITVRCEGEDRQRVIDVIKEAISDIEGAKVDE